MKKARKARRFSYHFSVLLWHLQNSTFIIILLSRLFHFFPVDLNTNKFISAKNRMIKIHFACEGCTEYDVAKSCSFQFF